jgi:hypothetical protein
MEKSCGDVLSDQHVPAKGHVDYIVSRTAHMHAPVCLVMGITDQVQSRRCGARLNAAWRVGQCDDEENWNSKILNIPCFMTSSAREKTIWQYYVRATAPPNSQTPLFIKPCSKIGQILLVSSIEGPFCSGHFKPLSKFFPYYGFGKWLLLVHMLRHKWSLSV